MAFLCSPLPSCSVAIFSKSNTDGFRSSPSCRLRLRPISASHILAPAIDRSAMVISETVSEDELWAAACLRVRTFNELNPSSYNIQVSSSPYYICLVSLVLDFGSVHPIHIQEDLECGRYHVIEWFGLKVFLFDGFSPYVLVLMLRFAVQVSFRITEDTWRSVSSRRLRREFQEREKVLRGCPA